jgi:hypothetical protein
MSGAPSFQAAASAKRLAAVSLQANSLLEDRSRSEDP